MTLLLIRGMFVYGKFIYLFIYLCSLHVFTKNGMIRKISKTVHVWPGIVFYYSYQPWES